MPAGALVWDGLAERWFTTGASKGVLYHQVGGVYNDGEAWNGLTNVTEQPTGGESNKTYADNIPYLNLISIEEFGATVECITVPDGFLQYDGKAKTGNGLLISGQKRSTFGFCWRTEKGNADDEEAGYVLKIAYGLSSGVAEKVSATKSDTPEPATYSFPFTSIPVPVTGRRASAFVEVDSTDPLIDPANLAALELILYGTVGVAPRLPLPDEIDTILGAGVDLVTPLNPTFDAIEDEITIPSVAGVVYYIDGDVVTGVVAITEDTIVTAAPDEGYTFTGVFVTSWMFDFA